MPMVPTTERGPLMLSPRLMPMPTTMELMVLAMLDMLVLAMATVPTPMPMVPTMERGPLMLSPRLMPMPTTMELTVLAMLDMLVLAMATVPTTERGPLMRSPRLMPTTMVPTPMPMVDSM